MFLHILFGDISPSSTGLGQTGWSVRESTSNGNGWYNSEAEDDDQDQDQDNEDGERAQEGARLSRASSTHSSANKVTSKF